MRIKISTQILFEGLKLIPIMLAMHFLQKQKTPTKQYLKQKRNNTIKKKFHPEPRNDLQFFEGRFHSAKIWLKKMRLNQQRNTISLLNKQADKTFIRRTFNFDGRKQPYQFCIVSVLQYINMRQSLKVFDEVKSIAVLPPSELKCALRKSSKTLSTVMSGIQRLKNNQQAIIKMKESLQQIGNSLGTKKENQSIYFQKLCEQFKTTFEGYNLEFKIALLEDAAELIPHEQQDLKEKSMVNEKVKKITFGKIKLPDPANLCCAQFFYQGWPLTHSRMEDQPLMFIQDGKLMELLRKTNALANSQRGGTILLHKFKNKNQLVFEGDQDNRYSVLLEQDSFSQLVLQLHKIFYNNPPNIKIDYVPVLANPYESDFKQPIYNIPRIVVQPNEEGRTYALYTPELEKSESYLCQKKINQDVWDYRKINGEQFYQVIKKNYQKGLPYSCLNCKEKKTKPKRIYRERYSLPFSYSDEKQFIRGYTQNLKLIKEEKPLTLSEIKSLEELELVVSAYRCHEVEPVIMERQQGKSFYVLIQSDHSQLTNNFLSRCLNRKVETEKIQKVLKISHRGDYIRISQLRNWKDFEASRKQHFPAKKINKYQKKKQKKETEFFLMGSKVEMLLAWLTLGYKRDDFRFIEAPQKNWTEGVRRV